MTIAEASISESLCHDIALFAIPAVFPTTVDVAAAVTDLAAVRGTSAIEMAAIIIENLLTLVGK